MTGVSDRLAAHCAALKNGDVTISTSVRLMTLLRELLEERGELKKYPLLRMFCDWTVHTKLDRSKAGSALLELIDAMFANSRTVDAQFAALMNDASPAKLQQQMVDLLVSANVDPSAIAGPKSGAKILRCLVQDLRGKPVSRRPEETAKITAQRLKQGYRHVADRIEFAGDPGSVQIVLVVRQIEPVTTGEIRLETHWGV